MRASLWRGAACRSIARRDGLGRDETRRHETIRHETIRDGTRRHETERDGARRGEARPVEPSRIESNREESQWLATPRGVRFSVWGLLLFRAPCKPRAQRDSSDNGRRKYAALPYDATSPLIAIEVSDRRFFATNRVERKQVFRDKRFEEESRVERRKRVRSSRRTRCFNSGRFESGVAFRRK